MSGSLSPWLALREAADQAARSRTLARAVAGALPRGRPIRVLDLGSGTGANLRYLAPFFSVPQDWLLVDMDRELLAEAASRTAGLDGVRVETTSMNLGPLDSADMFADRDLVTASALLDLVSEQWLQRLALACRSAGAQALFALTYDGRSSCSPPDATDEMIRELMNRHQRNNDKGFGRAAGPDGAAAAARAFSAEGYQVRRERTDWRLPADAREFQRQLFAGWAEAAREIAPEQSAAIDAWHQRRLAHLETGRSTVIVGHEDLLCLTK